MRSERGKSQKKAEKRSGGSTRVYAQREREREREREKERLEREDDYSQRLNGRNRISLDEQSRERREGAVERWWFRL